MAAAKTPSKYKYTITEICMTFLHKNRFYATILSKLVKIPTKTIPTAGVGFNKLGKLTLYYNEEFLLNLSLEKAQAVLEHEVLHVFFRHLTRHPKECTQVSKHLDDLKNIGCDIAINQYIPQMPNKQDCIDNFMSQLKDQNLPAELKKKIEEELGKDIVGSHTPEMYGFDRDKSADYYIEELKKKFPQQKQCPQCGSPTKDKKSKEKKDKQGDSEGEESQDKQDQQGQGSEGEEGGEDQQGQGSGQGQDQQQGKGKGDNKCPCCGQEKGKGKGKGKGNSLGGTVDSHDLWDKVVDEENGQQKITDVKDLDFDPEYETVSIVQKAIKECKDFGNLPAFVKREIEELQKPINRYNWKHELKVFVNSMLSVSKRLSQKRVNRRFANQRYILPGKKKARRPSILVVRDTSGSVFDDATQNEFLNEMINISKFATIHVSDCDTIIHQTYQVSKRSDFREYKGGGGTSFEPAFIKAKELGVDGIIYITDTYGSFPKVEDIGKYAHKTIWVTINQEKVDIPFGKHVNIPLVNRD